MKSYVGTNSGIDCGAGLVAAVLLALVPGLCRFSVALIDGSANSPTPLNMSSLMSTQVLSDSLDTFMTLAFGATHW